MSACFNLGLESGNEVLAKAKEAGASDLCVNIHIYFVNSESSEQVECAIFITFINLKNCVYEYIRINKRHVVSILLFLCLLYECASKKH